MTTIATTAARLPDRRLTRRAALVRERLRDRPIVPNLTPHATGLDGWTYEQFDQVVRHGIKPDGSALHAAMPVKAFSKLEDRDVKALWMWLQTVEPKAEGGR